jgi:hypothetical protein
MPEYVTRQKSTGSRPPCVAHQGRKRSVEDREDDSKSKDLKASDLSIYFHLTVVDAAKKLGICTTSLKKVCQKFGLERSPGRKVRSFENTIHGLDHTIAVDQGVGMEELVLEHTIAMGQGVGMKELLQPTCGLKYLSFSRRRTNFCMVLVRK